MSEKAQNILRKIEAMYQHRLEEETHYSDLFFEDLASEFEYPVKNPNEPVVIGVWADFGKYDATEFPQTFAQAMTNNALPDRSVWLTFQDGYALFEVAENAVEAIQRMRVLTMAGIGASQGWLEPEWGIVAFQD